MGSLRGSYYSCHYFRFRSSVPSLFSSSSTFPTGQTSRLQVGQPGWDAPARPHILSQLPGSSLSPARKPPCHCSALHDLLNGCAFHIFPFQPRPLPVLQTQRIGVPVHSLPTWPCLSAIAFELQGRAFSQLFPSAPQLSTHNACRGIVGGVRSRAHDSSASSMAPSGFLVQLLENKVLQGGVRENRIFHSLQSSSWSYSGATIRLRRFIFL